MNSFGNKNNKSKMTDKLKRVDLVVLFVSFTIFINGVVSILQVIVIRFPYQPYLYGIFLPFELLHWSRTLSLTLGFMLIYLSLKLLQKRKVAWWVAIITSSVVAIIHLGQTKLWYTILAPLTTLVILIIYKKRFTVRSEQKSIIQGLTMLGLCIIIALSYGTIGFWFLDKQDFGISFSFTDSIIRTLRELTFIGNSDLHPITPYADWFIKSFHIFMIVVASFAAYSLFRPVAYRYITLPHERHMAKQIVNQYGHSSYDFFKTWPDKSFFFSNTNRSFISYRVQMGVAICLGDPVGVEDELESIIVSFMKFCRDNGWIISFLLPDLIALYEKLEFSFLKIAESAVVDLKRFCEHTSKKKYFRYIRRKMENDGYNFVRLNPPYDDSILNEIEEVSTEWLGIKGHREFGFIQGNFNREYIAKTPITVLKNRNGKIIAFVNEIPSYRKGEATIDLMRHRPGVHWGAMDYIFLKLMENLWNEGYKTFYLGLAGIANKPGPTLVEKTIFQISKHFNWLVRSKGVRQYKAKFEPIWEDRFLVYSGPPFALAKIAIAIIRIL